MTQQSFWIGREGGATFAHLHMPRKTTEQRSTGVIIVPSLGHEYTHGYRALRALACAAAAAGYFVIRPDLRGTGNSTEGARVGVETWLEDIERARSYLLQTRGLASVVLVGVRASALLVLESAQAEEGIILWNPCSSGRTFIRELKVLGKIDPSASGRAVLESGGLVFDDPLQQAIEGLQVKDNQSRTGHVLLVEKVDRPADVTLANSIRQRAASLQNATSDEFVSAFREPHNTRIPLKFIDSAVQWLFSKYPNVEVLNPVVDESSALSTELPGVVPAVAESVLRINTLFAILTHAVDSKSIVLMSNGGSAHHVGPNRLYVDLARTLSEQHIDCLRYDLANLGDSVDLQTQFESGGVDPTPEAITPYPDSASGDLQSILSWARQQGYSRILMAGLCAGAYAAFDLARQSDDSFPIELILINPLTFQWREGMSLEIPSEYSNLQQAKAYQSASRDWQHWKRLFTGDIDYLLLIQHLLGSITSRLMKRSRELAQYLGLREPPLLTQDLLRIAASGSRLRFYFAERDPGLEILRTAGNRCLSLLSRSKMLQIRTFKGADHTFKRVHERDELIRTIVEDIGDERAGTT